MQLLEALKRILASVAAAFVSWYLAALLLEKLIPGFVAPFVDMADLGLIALLASFVLVAVAPPISSRIKKVGLALVVVVVSSVALAILWFSLNGFGTMDLILFASMILTVILSLYVLLIAPRTK